MKLFVVWVTNLVNKYRFDIFFRTECNVIALQTIFVLTVIILISVFFDYFYKDVTKTLFNELVNNINSNKPITPDSLGSVLSSLEYLKTKNYQLVILIIIVTTSVFGYLIARITLIPARNSLDSQKLFIGNIAHELRNPLASIKTAIEVALMKDKLEHDYIKEMLASNIDELDRISDTINNLLSINTLVLHSKIKLDKVSLEQVVEAVIANLNPLLKIKNHNLVYVKNGDSYISGKKVALEQIILNILKNAINYTPNGGTIHVSVNSHRNDFVGLVIEDNGVGITKSDIFHVFEPFYRADPSRVRGSSGSGLGLAIVNELVKLHKGKIYIRSVIKKGTVVTIDFPHYSKDQYTN